MVAAVVGIASEIPRIENIFDQDDKGGASIISDKKETGTRWSGEGVERARCDRSAAAADPPHPHLVSLLVHPLLPSVHYKQLYMLQADEIPNH